MLNTAPFGPLTKGVVQRADSSLPLTGAMRAGRNVMYSGINALSIRPGVQTALTLKDDQGTPANVTSVRHVGAFADGAVAVGYSSTTGKAYLYRLDASLTGYYDSTGTFHASSTAAPIAVLWSGLTATPDVLVTEGLGMLYVAHTVASDANGLYWPTKTYTDFSSTTASLSASGTDGSSAGTDTAYFNGVIAFQQALWGWGYGSGTTATTGFRPEMARFSPPSFGNLQVSDSITVGDRVRSQRERIVGAGVAGEALMLGATNMVTRVTGYGRDSWYKTPLDHSYGFVGPKCMATAGDTLYYWSRRGPMRIESLGPPEPLWDALPNVVAAIPTPSTIVAGFDPDRDQVTFTYDTGTGVRSWCAFDVRRNVWIGPDNDWGVSIACAGIVEPYTASTANPPSGPTGAPISPSTTNVGTTTATANWAVGDASATTEVSYQVQGGSTWYVAATALAAGVTSFTFTALTASVAYQWRARHQKNGQFSSYLGPSTSTQFTTAAAQLNPPTNCNAVANSPNKSFSVSWTNSGEAGVSTEIWRSSDGASFSLASTVGTGVASATVPVFAYGTWYFEVRHIKSGATSSVFSNVASDTVTKLV